MSSPHRDDADPAIQPNTAHDHRSSGHERVYLSQEESETLARLSPGRAKPGLHESGKANSTMVLPPHADAGLPVLPSTWVTNPGTQTPERTTLTVTGAPSTHQEAISAAAVVGATTLVLDPPVDARIERVGEEVPASLPVTDSDDKEGADDAQPAVAEAPLETRAVVQQAALARASELNEAARAQELREEPCAPALAPTPPPNIKPPAPPRALRGGLYNRFGGRK